MKGTRTMSTKDVLVEDQSILWQQGHADALCDLSLIESVSYVTKAASELTEQETVDYVAGYQSAVESMNKVASISNLITEAFEKHLGQCLQEQIQLYNEGGM